MSEKRKDLNTNKKPPSHLGGRPGGEKRNNEPAKKSYRNHTKDHQIPTEDDIKTILKKRNN